MTVRTLARVAKVAGIALVALLALDGCGDSTVARTVKSIHVTPSFPSVPAGVAQTFAAVATYSDNSTADISTDVTWASASPTVATISSAGVATAVSVGTSNITAACAVAQVCHSLSGSATLNVTAAALVSVAVTPDAPSIAKGVTQQFVATGTYSDGSQMVLTSQAAWASATPAVATITAAGLASGITTGSSSITATFDGIASPGVPLTVTAATLTAIQISAPAGTLVQGTSQQYTASGSYTDGTSSDVTANVTWMSATPAVAAFPTSGASGDIGAAQPGSTTVTASLGAVTSNALSLTVTPGSTTLAASVSALALSVLDTSLNAALTGAARQITITNTGADTAINVTVNATGLPSGTALSSTCATLAAGSSCAITVTPGATPSAAAGDTNPVAATLTIQGSNTNSLNPTVSVLTYGSVYQSGYLFSVDDTTAVTGSIGGKVFALADQGGSGTIWTSSYSTVPGIDETSTPSAPSPVLPSPNADGYVGCRGAADGACNQGNLNLYYPGGALANDAVNLCDPTIGGFSDWYLPAICELGYDPGGQGTGCGSAGAPLIQNIQSSLLDTAVSGMPTNAYYWSSTESSVNPQSWVFVQYLATTGSDYQVIGSKGASVVQVRCVRALTQ